MRTHHLHGLLLFVTFILAVIVLIDGVTYLSMAKEDVPTNKEGEVVWMDIILYATAVPIFSVLGTAGHIFGLHLTWISPSPESPLESIILVLGSAAHTTAWLIIGSIWTTCEVGTFAMKTISQPDSQESPIILVNRTGPAFCPQHKFVNGGLNCSGAIAVAKVAFAWVLVAVTLVNLVCATRIWINTRYFAKLNEGGTTRRDSVESSSTSMDYSEKSVTFVVMGGYETKV